MLDETDKLKVLVVDDNTDAAASLCGLLRHMGCDTASASGIRSALQAATDFKPAVVILDLEMPGADGCQVLQEMKALDGGPEDALYVCLTGSDPAESRRRCEQAGFNRFHSKPLWLWELTEILDEARARLAQARYRHKRRPPVKRAAL